MDKLMRQNREMKIQGQTVRKYKLPEGCQLVEHYTVLMATEETNGLIMTLLATALHMKLDIVHLVIPGASAVLMHIKGVEEQNTALRTPHGRSQSFSIHLAQLRRPYTHPARI